MPRRQATRHRLPPPVLGHSRDLRHSLTEPEKRLWERLRNHALGVHIRRQYVVLGQFIPDFYCASARLCIEIDGESHAEVDQEAYDAARTKVLATNGYRVLGFANRDVMRDLDAVIEAIRVACAVG